MPVPKRYFKVSHEINNDPEVWELTETFGDRSLRLWLQYLSIFDRNENSFKLSGLWVSQLAKVTKLNLQTVVKATVWMIDRGWIVVSGQGPEDWTETARRLAGDWPKNHRRLAGDLPETHRRMVTEWSENGRRISLYAANYRKYNRSQEQKGNENVPLLTNPTPTPNLTSPSLRKEKKEEEKKDKSCEAPQNGARLPLDATRGASVQTWEAYAAAYVRRYGHPPIRNAKVNGILSQFVTRLPADKAPLVAAFYVDHNSPFYVSRRHPVNLLLQDAEGLHTQWISGVKATTGEAKNAERRDDAMAQIQRIEAMRRDRA